MQTIGDAFNVAIAAHQAGRLTEAEQIYRQIVVVAPQHSDAWHLLGVIAYQSGKPAVAVELIGRAIALIDTVGVYHANLGEAYRVLGDTSRAEKEFLRALELDPQHAEARNNYALLLQATGRASESIEQLDRALARQPNYPEAHNNRGLALEHLGRFGEARAAYAAALRLRPSYAAPAENMQRLAVKLRMAGRLEEACDAFQDLATINPNMLGAFSNLGALQFELNRYADAAESCRRAVTLHPTHVDAWNNLGSALLRLRRYEESEQALRTALRIKPDFPDALNNLGLLNLALDRLDDAADCFQRTLAQDGNYVPGLVGLGLVCFRRGQYHEARQYYQRAVDLRPEDSDALNKLGTCVMAQGCPAEAASVFARCLQLNPKFVTAHSNFLFCHLYLPDITLARLAELHHEFERRHCAPAYRDDVRHANAPDPDRRLRVGFVSADLRKHPIGFLLTDVIANLDRNQLEIACYSTRRGDDEVRTRLQQHAALWRNVEMVEDDELAALIRADGIDVLIDLSGHTSGSRITAFARRPAPVQATWMGYPSTTGVSAIDYLISDRSMTPEGVEPHFAERIERMPEAAACYRPPVELPELAEPSLLKRRHATFGSFNNSSKINPQVVALWSRVLQAVPGSRMLLKFRALHETAVQDRLAGWFADCGIDRSRLEFETFSPMHEMLASYGRVDVALDTFPFSGGTTTMLAMLMGVPVVSLPGETMASRQSLSALKSAGSEETIATDADGFVAKAAALVENSRWLAELRPLLRQRMLTSPLCDAPRFAGQFAQTIRGMWRRWCGKK